MRITAKDFKAMIEVYYSQPTIKGTGDGTLGARVSARAEGHAHWLLEMRIWPWPGDSDEIKAENARRYWAAVNDGEDYVFS